ncbi:MAG: hypothetical protein J6S71_06515 [Clostridia bacterium]|nr:hypothetical protein [Clostridia bacterium]
MKIKLSTILLTLALIAGTLAACYPVTGNDGYRTMPVGTGTDAPAPPVTLEPEYITSAPEATTVPPEVTEDPSVTNPETTAEQPAITTSPVTSAPEETTSEPPEVITFEFDVIEQNEEIGTVGKDKCMKIIRYPALKGLENSAAEAKINKLISQISSVEYQNRLPNAGDLVKNGTYVSYEITETAITYLGNNIVSVRSQGMIDYKDDTKDEIFVYCNLIDLSTGKDITLKKTYSDFGKIMTLFTSGKFKQISGDKTLTSSMTYAQLIEQYKYYSQYGTYPETYFTKDELIIVVETNSTNGFFAEFSIALSEVNDCLVLSPTK